MKSDIVRKYIIPLIILSAVISNIGYCYGAPLKAVTFYEMHIGIPEKSVTLKHNKDSGEQNNIHIRLYQTNNEDTPYIMLASVYRHTGLPSFITIDDVKKMPGVEEALLKAADASDKLFGVTKSANKEIMYTTVNGVPVGISFSYVGSPIQPYAIGHLFYVYNGSTYIVVIVGNMNSGTEVLLRDVIDVAKTILFE